MRGFLSTTAGKVLLAVLAVIAAIVAWTGSTSASAVRDQQRALAEAIADAYIEEVIVARNWVSEHAGVYVTETPGVEPNRFLPEEDRVVVTTDGTRLVRVNPAYFVRLTEETSGRRQGLSIRVTSTDPLNPDNEPDSWERGALAGFASADDHASGVLESASGPVLRYAVPLVVEQSCTACHTQEAYVVGAIHGAVTLAMDYSPFVEATNTFERRSWMQVVAIGALALAFAALLGGMVLVTESRLRSANTALIRANDILESQSSAKTQFLATMSHDLRTPLNSIIGFSGILQMGMAGGLTAEQRKQIGIINSAGKHLLALINDVLDLSKVEAGRIVLVAEEFSAGDVVDGIVDIVRPLAEERGLDLRVSTPGDEGTLYSDRRRIEQVLINLLANAVKHTDSGYVALSLVPRVDDVDFVIEDTGAGIPIEHVGIILEDSYQPVGGPDKPKGAGLGLMISHKLAELLGGKIIVNNEPGCGSVYTFRVVRTLPDAPPLEE